MNPSGQGWTRQGQTSYGESKFTHCSCHMPTDHKMNFEKDLSGSVCMCGTVTEYKSYGDITSASLQTVDGHCLVLLPGNGGVTLWCNRGYEHISHSTGFIRRKSVAAGHYWGWHDEVLPQCKPQSSSPLTSQQLPHVNGRHWRHSLLPLQTIGVDRGSRSPPLNCFLSLLVYFLFKVMNGHRSLLC